ncbi:hypothetical protein EMIHUDRAFT_456540 [Emiliania huxleyi CCMP1516]|uniref:Uncharacterized protein n=2 Tax=Emiliania huxleyi TaxID=2903 RepID=A0A0D3K475_EMIH1|nr:hypothetical protein EMIHUDRAFT_456540 [Emiliania huxleyi CCMP1516]EOD30560.1 hypothetical protein EMIHUDRAFT_456540 [Emiliania huxleyi CCMP1516]|eukprot:XP_005782989.1 hypothetical protein EMIHUDRAFT_456540 [Emiliania huxleyi CCMP1516]
MWRTVTIGTALLAAAALLMASRNAHKPAVANKSSLLSRRLSTTAEPAFEPLCSVDWKRSKCMRGEKVLPCPERPHSGATPIGTGAWELTETYTYFLDRGLTAAIAHLVDGGSVLEFGAGDSFETIP